MIKTSYFAKYKGEDGVSIARITPKWFKGDTCKGLAPSTELLRDYKNGYCDEKGYKRAFIQELKKRDVHLYYMALKGKTLLCYEKSESFCHRHIVAKWFKRNGYEVEEL